jgi:hypothetical protein
VSDDVQPPSTGVGRAETAEAADDHAGRQWHRFQLLALSGAFAASTVLMGLATNVFRVPTALWFLFFAAIVLMVRRRLRYTAVVVTPSWQVRSVVIGVWAVSLGLTLELAQGRWWVWAAGAGVQLAAGALGTWWTER